MNSEDRPTFIEEARRAQLVRSAIETVNEIGHHRASLSEIAARAGVAKSAIVYYFGSKDALLLQVLDDVFAALGAAVERAVSEVASPAEKLRAYADGYLAHVIAHHGDVAAAVAIVVSHRDASGRPLYLAESEEDTALLRHILAAGMSTGEFRTMPVGVAATIIAALLDTAITEVQRDPGADLTVLRAEVVEFLVRAVRPEDSSG